MFTFSVANQSPWLIDYYNKYLPESGYLVEVGIGHIISPTYTLGSNYNKIECGSNSYDLLKNKYKGLLIDPIKEYCDEAQLVYSDNPNVLIECCGISDKEEELIFNMGDSFIRNSIPINTQLPYIGRRCKLYPLSSILEKYSVPHSFDLLSIDVEGFEERVLSTFNPELYSPKLIVIEINQVAKERIGLKLDQHYKLIAFDNLNGLFCRKDLL